MNGAYSVTVFEKEGEALVEARGEKYRLTLADLRRIGITDGAEADEDSLALLAVAHEKLLCIKKALVYLSYKGYAARALGQKLKRAGFPSDTVDEVIELLVRKGYLDDEALCKEYAAALQRSKGYGPMRIKKELYAKGFEREHIDLAVEELEDTPVEVIAAILAKKFPSLHPDDRQARAKAVAYLSSRGYEYDDINNAISALERE